MVSEIPKPKGYSNSVTLEENLSSIKEANTVLLVLFDAVTQHMRKDSNKAHSISVGIKFGNFKNQSHQISFSEPLSATIKYMKQLKSFLKSFW